MVIIDSGALDTEGSNEHEIVLKGGATYSICIDADDADVDFDVCVYDENNNLVEQDDDDDSDALCFVTPRWTGPFHVEVTATGSGKGGPYEMRVTDV